jgi:hypothetical protein
MLRWPRVALLSSAILPVNVLALTILVSSCLAGIFIACFVLELSRSRRTSPERDSLLPLDPDPTTDPSAEPPRQPHRP